MAGRPGIAGERSGRLEWLSVGVDRRPSLSIERENLISLSRLTAISIPGVPTIMPGTASPTISGLLSSIDLMSSAGTCPSTT